MLRKDVFEENCVYYNEPVVNKITGETFKDMYTCYKHDHSFSHYKAIMDSSQNIHLEMELFHPMRL